VLYYKKSLKIREEIGDKMGVSLLLGNIGKIYQYQGDNVLAFDYFIKSIKTLEGPGFKKTKVGISYIAVGEIYRRQGKYVKAMGYYKKSLELGKILNDKKALARTNYAIGIHYMNLENYEKTLSYIQRSMHFYKGLEHKGGIAKCYNSIGNACQFLGDFDLSFKNHQESLKIKEELRNIAGIAISYVNLGFLCLELGNINKAISYGEQSLSLINKSVDIMLKKEIYDLLYKSYKKTGQTDKALEMHELYLEISDSVNKLNNDAALTKQQLKYDFDKKSEIEQTKHNAEMKQQKLYLYSGLSGLILMILLAGVLYRNNIIKKQSNDLLKSKNLLINTQKEDIEKKQTQILDSINYAKRIQTSIMFPEEEIRKHLPGIFIFFQPKDVVSGDFYWFNKKKDLLFIAAVDCTGHGIPGAFMSMIGSSLLDVIIEEKGIYDPGMILNELHAGVAYTLKQEKNSQNSQDGMDMSLCCIDLKERTLKFAGAKNSLYIIKDNALESIKANCFSIGGIGQFSERIKNKIRFDTKTLTLEKDTCLYLFSDGYADQFNGKNRRLFGEKRFKSLLLEIHKKSPQQQKSMLSEKIDSWRGNSTQIDDMLVIGIKV
jgi:serine phosphatase RsbU (regulator of sigma subunit)